MTTIWIAKLHWGNHPFEAFGNSAEEAIAALRQAWNKYAANSKEFNSTGLRSKNGGVPMFNERSIEGIVVASFARTRHVHAGQAYLNDVPCLASSYQLKETDHGSMGSS